MDMSLAEIFTARGLGILATPFVVVVGLFVIDISQTRDAVRRNYPVIGPFANPPGLRRMHVRVMQENGRSVPLDELLPEPAVCTIQAAE